MVFQLYQTQYYCHRSISKSYFSLEILSKSYVYNPFFLQFHQSRTHFAIILKKETFFFLRGIQTDPALRKGLNHMKQQAAQCFIYYLQ